MLTRTVATLTTRPISRVRSRCIHASSFTRQGSSGLTNIIEGGSAAIQVKTITSGGILLADGLILPSACIFLDNRVFLWDVPDRLWDGWDKQHFEVFDVVVPKPEILLFGTGKTVSFVPPVFRQYLNGLGIQVDVMDTWNACSTYNLLVEEGREVAAALLPLSPRRWQRLPSQ
ncbi:uncharacterized protein LAESUDRAFT_655553 [Laetiporus sulphureus 93-53]|uniref:NADH dehydrogenase [ubiquinone] 1 alpha subcomplex assembly factor 3 n=1 Tax=Laetiporus sulphureus 93-53 TaxID=1314785 RepID=A0A165DSH6_9APHY|nr:uncharacterized protein LAESUDRAFT_655553 [Laetiporus sulphureus 93-53]KZT05540.1 hypothetical protein LAESUDRAFT_655553 [Laetiporus sulphureus 93-53]